MIHEVGSETKDLLEEEASLAEMVDDTRGEAVMLLEEGPGEGDAGATKLACRNNDTS